MRKFFSLLLLVLALMLTGCHGKEESVKFVIPDDFDTSKEMEITFWAKNDTNKAQTNIYKKAISDFQKLYPNITVNMRLYTDYAKIYNDVITNIATDTTPNVCVTYPDHIATYLTGKDIVVPLDQLLTNEKYGLAGSELAFDGPSEEEMIKEYLNEGIIGGHQYALPFMRSTEACYINKTYVEKLGYTIPEVLTWDFIWEVSEAATKQDANGNYEINGQKVMIPFIYKSTDNMMIQMLRQKHAGYSTENGEIQIFNDTTREILEEISTHVRSGAFSTFKISSYPANFLNAGQCIFAIDSTAGSTWMGSQAPLLDISEEALVDFETVVMPIPQYEPEQMQMISQGPSVCIFQKDDSQEVLASWLFAQYLLSNDVQIAYAKTEGYVPVTKKAQESPQYQEYLGKGGEDNVEHYEVKIKATQMLLDHLDDTFVTPVFNGATSLRSAAGDLIENVAKATRRKKEIDDAFFETLYSDMSSLYHLDQVEGTAGGKKDLGPLTQTAKILLISLAAAWVLIIIYVGIGLLKNRH